MRTRIGQRTYTHLLGQRRVPSRYAVATSKLLYYPTQGLSVTTPVTAWYERHQRGSPLRADDWELFADPHETTYAVYTALRAEREAHVSAVLRGAPAIDRAIAPAWAARLHVALTALRYPRHGLMMAAAYAGSMAPSGRVTVALAFQSGDETRHVQRLQDRLTALSVTHASTVEDVQQTWMHDPAWQPLRRVIEELLVTYDWGESMIVLNHVLKPRFDGVLEALAVRAGREGDGVTRDVLRSLAEDAAWHQLWTRALLALLMPQHDNRAVVDRWTAAWVPRVEDAMSELARSLDAGSHP